MRPWWQGAVVYQIYPLSFRLADPVGRRRRLGTTPEAPPAGEGRLRPWSDTPAVERLQDGAGDLEGVRRALPYLADLGIDAIWLSPIYPSPMHDFGYDVADYCAVSPLLGDFETFDALLAEAHALGLRVILDWVPNHTSSEHPWFVDARSSRASEHRDFYVWRDPDPDRPERPPNNWRASFGAGPAWTFDEETGQWYLHLFLPEQPDLDWANTEVVRAMEQTLDFWLDRGVDGFRIDVVHALGKPDGLGDVAPEQAEIPYSALVDEPSTHPILRQLRARVDRRTQQPVLLGEVFLIDTAKVAPYYGDGDELHLAFNFAPMFTRWSARAFRRRLAEIAEHLESRGAWPTWVLSSHDSPRHRTRYGGSERRARAAAVLSLTVRGTICLYQGEELGLEDAELPESSQVDPGGRDGCRAPIPWEATVPHHGWELGSSRPWLPFPTEAAARSVEAESYEPGSVLALYRRLLAQRRAAPVLRHGALELVEAGEPDRVLGYLRTPEDGAGGENSTGVLVLVNFADSVERAPAPDGTDAWLVAVSSAGEGALSREGDVYRDRLGPEEAVVLVRRHRI